MGKEGREEREKRGLGGLLPQPKGIDAPGLYFGFGKINRMPFFK